MFSHLFSALLGRQARQNLPLTDPEAAHALGALLIRVAKTAPCDTLPELCHIERLLLLLHELNRVEAAQMWQACQEVELQAPDTEIFVEMIRQGVDFDDRLLALETLWQIVLEEGRNSAEERAKLERVRAALGLTAADSATARSLALEHS